MTTQTQFAAGDRVGFQGQPGLEGTVLIPEIDALWRDEPRITVRWDYSCKDKSWPIVRKLFLLTPRGPDRIEEMFS